jgi:hypothetical protein
MEISKGWCHRILPALLVLCAVILVGAGFQCSRDQKHKAAQTAATLATALQGFEQANEELYSQKLISARRLSSSRRLSRMPAARMTSSWLTFAR